MSGVITEKSCRLCHEVKGGRKRFIILAAMGRSQSTPGLVESRGKVPLEEMWLPGGSNLFGGLLTATTTCTSSSAFEAARWTPPPPLPLMMPGGSSSAVQTPMRPMSGGSDMMMMMMGPPDSPSAGSTSSYRSRQKMDGSGRGGAGDCLTPASQARSGTTMPCDSMTQLASGNATPLLGSHEVLDTEIKRLRERLHTVEAENAAMSVKLNQQQWELENRLAEIEMQICGSRSTSSMEDNERNRESII